MLVNPLPGQVWRINLDPTVGSETGKERPVVVVSTAQFSTLPVRLVVPVTGWDEKHQRFFWRIPLEPTRKNGLSKKSVADSGQVRVVSIERFKECIGSVTANEALDIKAGLSIALDIQMKTLESD